MKVQLTYFKDGGKYYSEGEFETTLTNVYDIFKLCGVLKVYGFLPGLVIGANEFYVLVTVHNHDYEHTHLITFDYKVNVKLFNSDVVNEFNRIKDERLVEL